MSNPYYARALSITPGTNARSAAVLAEFDRLVSAFDTMNAAAISPLLSRFDFTNNSLTLTGTVDLSGGTVRVPTPALSETDLSKAASLSYVQQWVSAGGTVVPTSAGHAGDVLTGDGTGYGWQLKFPAQSASTKGKMLRSTGVKGSEDWFDVFAIGYGGMLQVNASTTLDGTKRTIDVASATAGAMVTLPDATTLRNGDSFLFHWSGGAAADTQGVVNGAGSLVYGFGSPVLSPVLYLTDNSTVAGTWKVWDTADGTLTASPSTVQIGGPLATLRASRDSSAAAQIDATSFLVCCGSTGAGNGVDIFIATISTSDLTVTPGAVTNVGTDRVVWSRLLAVTSGWIFLYQDASNNLRGVGITVSGSTISASAPVTILASGPTIFKNNVDAASVGTTVVVTFPNGANTSISAVALQLSGTTILLGGAQVLATAASLTAATRVLAVSTTSFLWAAYAYDGANYTLRAGALTLSGGGVTITPGTVTTSASFTGGTYQCLDVALIDATTLFVAYQTNNTGASARVVSAVTTTPVFGTAQALTNTGMGGIVRHVDAVKAGSYYVVSFNDNSSGGRTATCTVSGTTVTEAASAGNILGTNGSVGSASTATAHATYDGTYVFACITNTGAFAAYTFSGAGYTQLLGFTTVTYPYSGPDCDKQQIWRLSGSKVVVAFGHAAGVQARAYKYGGI